MHDFTNINASDYVDKFVAFVVNEDQTVTVVASASTLGDLPNAKGLLSLCAELKINNYIIHEF